MKYHYFTFRKMSEKLVILNFNLKVKLRYQSNLKKALVCPRELFSCICLAATIFKLICLCRKFKPDNGWAACQCSCFLARLYVPHVFMQ